MSTYRTEAGAEVDLILERKDKVFAIEIKAAKRISTGDLRGLKSFTGFYGKSYTPLVIHMGEHPATVTAWKRSHWKWPSTCWRPLLDQTCSKIAFEYFGKLTYWTLCELSELLPIFKDILVQVRNENAKNLHTSPF